jgi:hypothetical protein
VTDQPMTDDERTLLEHCWAVRVNLPADVAYAARTARWLVDHASYAWLPAASVERLEQAAELLERGQQE